MWRFSVEWKPNLWPRIRERERDLKGMMYLGWLAGWLLGGWMDILMVVDWVHLLGFNDVVPLQDGFSKGPQEEEDEAEQ